VLRRALLEQHDALRDATITSELLALPISASRRDGNEVHSKDDEAPSDRIRWALGAALLGFNRMPRARSRAGCLARRYRCSSARAYSTVGLNRRHADPSDVVPTAGVLTHHPRGRRDTRGLGTSAGWLEVRRTSEVALRTTLGCWRADQMVCQLCAKRSRATGYFSAISWISGEIDLAHNLLSWLP
jgi:hypothetical protein